MNLLDLAVKVGVDDSASGRIGNIADGIVKKMASASRGVTAFGVAFGNIISNVASSAWGEFMGGIDSGVARFDILNNFEAVMVQLGESTESAAAAVDMVKAGLNGLPSKTQDIVQVVQQVNATGIGLENATRITLALNDAMLAGGQGTEGAARAMDAYNKMLAVGKVDMQHWNSMVQVAPAQMNQLAEAIIGADASQHDLYEAMQDGTVTFDQFNQALMDLDGGLGGFREQAESATKGIQTSMQNFESRIGTAWANILEQVDAGRIADVLDKISSHFAGWGTQLGQQLKPAADALFDLFDRMYGFAEFLGDLDGMMTSYDLGGATIYRAATDGEKLTAALKELGDVARDAFRGVDEDMRPFADAFYDIQDALGIERDGGLLSDFDEFAEGLGGFVDGLLDTWEGVSGKLMDSMAELFAGFELPDIDWNAAFQGANDFIDRVANFSADAFVAVLARARDIVKELGDRYLPVFENIEPVLESCAGHIENFLGPLNDLLQGEGPGWEQFWGYLDDFTIDHFGEALEYAAEQLDRLFGDVEDDGSSVVEFIAEAVAAIIDFIAAIINIVFSVVDIVLTVKETIEQLVDMLVRMWDIGTQNMRDLWDQFVSWIKGIFDGLKEKFEQLGKDFEIVPKMFQEGFDNIGEGIDGVVQWFLGLPDRILGALGDIGGLLFNAGANLVQGLIDGIESKFKDALAAIGSLTSLTVDEAYAGYQEYSPSHIFRDIGANLVEGLIVGVDRTAPKAVRAMDELAGKVNGAAMGPLGVGASVPRASFAASPALAAAGTTYNSWNVTLQYDASDDAKDMFEDLLGLMNDKLNMGV